MQESSLSCILSGVRSRDVCLDEVGPSQYSAPSRVYRRSADEVSYNRIGMDGKWLSVVLHSGKPESTLLECIWHRKLHKFWLHRDKAR